MHGGILFVSISVQKANGSFFGDNTSCEDLGEDNDVVITCAELELWMLNEL